MQDERGAADSGLECFFSALAAGFMMGAGKRKERKERKNQLSIGKGMTHQGEVHGSNL